MRLPVHFFILQLLQQTDSVHVPGLGSFALQRNPAEILPRTKAIVPPQNRGIFIPEKGNGSTLIRFIESRTGLPRKFVKKEVGRYVKSLTSTAETKGEMALDNFGVFSLDSKGQIRFRPEENAFNQEFAFLETMALMVIPGKEPAVQPQPAKVVLPVVSEEVIRPKSKEAIHPTLAPVTPADPIEEPFRNEETTRLPRRRIPLFIPLFAILFLLMSAFAYYQYRSQKASASAGITLGPAAIIDLDGDSTERQADPLHGNDNEKGNSASELSEIDQEPSSKPAEPEIANSSMKIPEAGPDIKDDAEQTPLPRDRAAEDQNRAETIVPLNESVPANGEKAPSNASKKPEGCLIIVGAFGVPGNVDRMQQKLNELGYESMTIPGRSLTKVGIVPVDCSPAEMLAQLRNVRTQVEQSAWIYKY